MYKTDINRARSLIDETKTIFKMIKKDTTLGEIKSSIINDNILSIRSLSTRQAVFRSLSKRFFSSPRIDMNLRNFLNSAKISNSAKNYIIFYKLAKDDELVYDITVKLLYDMMISNLPTINTENIQDFLNKNERRHSEILKWSINTKIRLARHYLSIMKDFQFLYGSKLKTLNKPEIPMETIFFLIFYLKKEKKILEKVLDQEDFKLLILDKNEIIDLINICFRKNLLDLNTTYDSFEEFYENNNLEDFINELTREI